MSRPLEVYGEALAAPHSIRAFLTSKQRRDTACHPQRANSARYNVHSTGSIINRASYGIGSLCTCPVVCAADKVVGDEQLACRSFAGYLCEVRWAARIPLAFDRLHIALNVDLSVDVGREDLHVDEGRHSLPQPHRFYHPGQDHPAARPTGRPSSAATAAAATATCTRWHRLFKRFEAPREKTLSNPRAPMGRGGVGWRTSLATSGFLPRSKIRPVAQMRRERAKRV